MGKEILTFGDIEIEKNNFYSHKSPAFLTDIDIKKILVSNKISSNGDNIKYFIGHLYNDHKVKPLHIMLPKTSAYLKSYDGQTKLIYFLIQVDGLLEKYETIWNRVSVHIKKTI